MKINKLNILALYAALIWAVIATAFVMFTFGQDKNPYGPISIIHHGTLVFYLLFSGLTVRAFFKKLSFSFKEAFIYSMIIGLIGNIVFLFLGLGYLNMTWDTSFPIYIGNMTDYFEKMFASGDLEKIGEVSKNGMKESIEKLKSATAWNIVFNDFSIKLVVSLILSFIIAVVMRKSTPELDTK